MKLNEIINIQKTGTYAGLRFTKSTITKLNKLITKFDIHNAVPDSKKHSTLLYSRKNLPNYEALGKLENDIAGESIKCEIWLTQDDEPKSALVLQYDCKDQVARHTQLMEEHDGTWDFPDYIPHVTLSYDCGKDFDLKSLNSYIKDNTFDIEMNFEYQEDLDLNWNNK